MSVSASTATAAGIAGCAFLSGVVLLSRPERPTQSGTAVKVPEEDDDFLNTFIAILLGVLALCVFAVACCRGSTPPPPPPPQKAAYEAPPTETIQHQPVLDSGSSSPPAGTLRGNSSEPAPTASETLQPNEIRVKVVKATGLEGLMKFTADKPYVSCMKVNAHTGAVPPSFSTAPIKEKTDPVWNEVHSIAPWAPGENLEFTVYNKGIFNSKNEGKCTLTSAEFFPNGFDGEIPIVSERIPTNSNPSSGNAPNAMLHVIVECPPDSKHLPAGWEGAVDKETGQVYYYNHDLAITQWDFPTA